MTNLATINIPVISEEAVKDRLEDKILAIIEQISTLRQEAGFSQADLAASIGMDKGQFSRLMHGASNMTLESVVRMESALNQEILVTPDDYAEHLVNDVERLKDIVDAAISVNNDFVWMLSPVYSYAFISFESGNTSVPTTIDLNLSQGMVPALPQISYQSQSSTSDVKKEFEGSRAAIRTGT